MKRKHLFLLLGLFFAIVFTSVTYAVQMQPRMVATTQGDETIEQRLDDPLFTLEVAFPLDLRVVASDRDYLTIQGPKKLLRKVVVTTKGLELRIRGHKSFWGNKFRGRLTGTLYTSDPNMLSELRLSSASKVISETIMRVTMFDLDMSGASTFVGEVHCNNADVKLNGASHARIKGNSGVLKVNQSGASKFVIEGECSELLLGIWGASLFDGKQLMAYRADMEVGGASKAYVAAQSLCRCPKPG